MGVSLRLAYALFLKTLADRALAFVCACVLCAGKDVLETDGADLYPLCLAGVEREEDGQCGCDSHCLRRVRARA